MFAVIFWTLLIVALYMMVRLQYVDRARRLIKWDVMFQWDDEPEPVQMIVFTKMDNPELARAEAMRSLSGWDGVTAGYKIISVELAKEWDEEDV